MEEARSPPVPSPRTRNRPVPIPAPSTKLHDPYNVLKFISFTTPLEDVVELRNPFREHSNVCEEIFSLPPSHPPPPPPKEEIYDQPKSNTSSIVSTFSMNSNSSREDATSPLKKSSPVFNMRNSPSQSPHNNESPIQRYIPRESKSPSDSPTYINSIKSPIISINSTVESPIVPLSSPKFQRKSNGEEENPLYEKMQPQNLLDVKYEEVAGNFGNTFKSTLELRKRQTIDNSLISLEPIPSNMFDCQYENFIPIFREAKPTDLDVLYEEIEPMYTNLPDRKENSELLTFDPVPDSLFLDNDQPKISTYSNTLAQAFKPIEDSVNYDSVPVEDVPYDNPERVMIHGKKPEMMEEINLERASLPPKIPERSGGNEPPEIPIRTQIAPEIPLRTQTLRTQIAPEVPLRTQTLRTQIAPELPLRTQTLRTQIAPELPLRTQTLRTQIAPELPERNRPELPERPKTLKAKVPPAELPPKIPEIPSNLPVKVKNTSEDTAWYDDDDEIIPPPPVLQNSIPREDLSKVTSAVHGASPIQTVKLQNTETKAKRSSKLENYPNLSKNFAKYLKWQISMDSTVIQKKFKRPSFGALNPQVYHAGILVQPGRDRSEWRVSLSGAALKWSSENNEHGMKMKLRDLVSIAAYTRPATSAPNSVLLQCIEIAWTDPGHGSQVQVFAASCEQNRSDWMQQIIDATCSDIFPIQAMHGYTLAGWLHIKDGVRGIWVSCWMLLRDRTLYYSTQAGTVLESDLRKATCISPQTTGGLDETHGCVLVKLQGQALYLQAQNQQDTNRWGFNIKYAALNNGPELETQQLTKDDVPVLVHKCINFVSQEGSMTQGIYRRNGSMKTVSKLLTDFHRDAWSVTLTRNEYSEHDVATALKRFFKDLPSPLIPLSLSKRLCELSSTTNMSIVEKISKYRHLLQKLSHVAFVTARRLFGHLHYLQLGSDKNLMNASNLAAIWGVSLMQQTPLDLIGECQTQVTVDVITLFPRLFDVKPAELALEQQMIKLLEQLHTASAPQTPTPSGDIKVWISLDKPGSQDTVQVSVNPQCTADEVCAKLDRGVDHVLQEYVLGGALRRPIRPSEKVFDVVIRWGYWDEVDRKDNQLVLSPCPFFEEMNRLEKPIKAACSEIKFADTRTKKFKFSFFELSQAKLSHYKDRKFASKAAEWAIEDIVWYLGHEPKRDPVTPWSITFIPRCNKPKRSREHPFFGNTLGGTNMKGLVYLCAAMSLAEQPDKSLEF